MKTFLILLMYCLTTGNQVYASDAWEQVAGLALGGITGTSFITPSDGWLSTGDGSILRTNDAGKTWHSLALPRGTPGGQGIVGLGFAARGDGTHCGWALTTSGSILYSRDGERLETKQLPVGAPAGMQCIDALDALHVWIGGERLILRTTDGGDTWVRLDFATSSGEDQEQHGPPPTCTLLNFWDSLHGVGVFTHGESGARVSSTQDGGVTWVSIREGVAASQLVRIQSGRSVKLLTSRGKPLAEGGHVSVDSRLLEKLTSRRTDSYGYPLSAPLRYEVFSSGVVLATERVHRPGGEVSSVSVTTDGAASWRRLFITTELLRVQFVTDSDGHAVGGGGRTTLTSDGGYTWIHSILPTDQDFYGVHFVSASVGWLAGGFATHGLYGIHGTNSNACVWSSRDGGKTWEKCAELPAGRPGYHDMPETIHDIFFADAKRGWIITDGMTQEDYPEINGCSPREYGRVLHSQDAGRTWKQVYYGAPLNKDIVMNKRGEMLASGYRIVRSRDGNTWNNVSFVNTPPRLAFVDDSHAIVVDFDGFVRVTSDSGRSWTDKSLTTFRNSQTNVKIGAIAFRDSQVGWCFGPRVTADAGTPTQEGSGIFLTQDGGATWKEYLLKGSALQLKWATDACALPSGQAWVIGDIVLRHHLNEIEKGPNTSNTGDGK